MRSLEDVRTNPGPHRSKPRSHIKPSHQSDGAFKLSNGGEDIQLQLRGGILGRSVDALPGNNKRDIVNKPPRPPCHGGLPA